jgi:hypothetical protein
MWLLNKDTGLVWEVTDNELIRRLTASERYKETKRPQAEDQSPSKEETTEPKSTSNVKRPKS